MGKNAVLKKKRERDSGRRLAQDKQGSDAKHCCRCILSKSKLKSSRRQLVLNPPESLFDLPEELLVKVSSFLSARDLSKTRQVSTYLRNLIDGCLSIWSNTSFQDIWPSKQNRVMFERAAEAGNIESLAKLGLCSLYVYNFDTSVIKCEKTSLEHGGKAAKYFTRIDELVTPSTPLTWMFIRPPWALIGERRCMKECMLEKMQSDCVEGKVTKQKLFNIGKAVSLKEEQNDQESVRSFYSAAAEKGCCHSQYELLLMDRQEQHKTHDAGVKLESLRCLQDCAKKGHIHATVDLCLKYSNGDLKHISKKQGPAFMRQIIANCRPSGIHKINVVQPELNSRMRCILVNWMAEVCDVKNMPSEALHMAVDCLDRYLQLCPVMRKRLQLVGVTCVVLASKYYTTEYEEILTIRESAWLTDNSYQYNEVVIYCLVIDPIKLQSDLVQNLKVVKILGEIIGVLRGKLVRMTSHHYGKILSSLAALDANSKTMVDYLVDSSLQDCEFGRYKPSQIAAAAVFLTNILVNKGELWSQHLTDCTGYEVKDLANCVALLHSKCLMDDSVIVDGNLPISGIKEKYIRDLNLKISKELPDLSVIRSRIEDLEPRLISRPREGTLYFQYEEERNLLDPRDKNAQRISELNSSVEGFFNGYEGDLEDNIDFNCSHEELSFFNSKANKLSEDRDEDQLSVEVQETLNSSRHMLIYESERDGLTPSIETSIEKLSDFSQCACNRSFSEDDSKYGEQPCQSCNGNRKSLNTICDDEQSSVEGKKNKGKSKARDAFISPAKTTEQNRNVAKSGSEEQSVTFKNKESFRKGVAAAHMVNPSVSKEQTSSSRNKEIVKKEATAANVYPFGPLTRARATTSYCKIPIAAGYGMQLRSKVNKDANGAPSSSLDTLKGIQTRKRHASSLQASSDHPKRQHFEGDRKK